MNENIFIAILPLKVKPLFEKIAERFSIEDEDAMGLLYKSKLYSLLEREETKLWYYSVDLLFDMFMEEKATGKISFPEN
jgi:hypothetical protein